jgi:hypothetical protein
MQNQDPMKTLHKSPTERKRNRSLTLHKLRRTSPSFLPSRLRFRRGGRPDALLDPLPMASVLAMDLEVLELERGRARVIHLPRAVVLEERRKKRVEGERGTSVMCRIQVSCRSGGGED